MLGLFGGKQSEHERELERKRIERLMRSVDLVVTKLKDGDNPATMQTAEAYFDRANQLMKDESKLDRKWRDDGRKRVKDATRDVFTRHVDKALDLAQDQAHAGKKSEMRASFERATEYMMAGAKYGITDEYRKFFKGRVDIIRQTGGVSHQGRPTAAKPQGDA